MNFKQTEDCCKFDGNFKTSWFFKESKAVRSILTNRVFEGDYNETLRIITILSALEIVLKNNIKGDIVQLGSESSEISKYIKMMLDYYDIVGSKINRDYHIYNEWKINTTIDLNDIMDVNHNICDIVIKPGITLSTFVNIYEKENIQCPILHSGGVTTTKHYPKKISFVYINSDIYQNIMSCNNILNNLPLGGCIILNTYPNIIGCTNAIKKLSINNIINNNVLNVNDNIIIIKNIEPVEKTEGIILINDTIKALYTKDLEPNTYIMLYGNNKDYRIVNNKLICYDFQNFNDAFGDHLPNIIKKFIFKVNNINDEILSMEIKENGKMKFTNIQPNYIKYVEFIYNGKKIVPYMANNYLNLNDLFDYNTENNKILQIKLLHKTQAKNIEFNEKGHIRIVM